MPELVLGENEGSFGPEDDEDEGTSEDMSIYSSEQHKVMLTQEPNQVGLSAHQ